MSATVPPTRTSLPDVRRPPAQGRPSAQGPPTDTPRPALPAQTPRSAPTVRTATTVGAAPVAVRSREVGLLPNLLLPGVSHAGAAVLAADLGRHPQLCLPVDRRAGMFTPVRYGRPVEIHPYDYDRQYSGWNGQSYRLETSQHYFDGGRPMAEALAGALPGLKVILLLRDPAQRLWTGYSDKVVRGRLPRAISFDTFVDQCLALRANGADRFEGNRHFRTLSSGFYIEFLPDWLEVFGPRLRLMFTEDLLRDPVGGLRDVLTWLELDPGQTRSLDDTSVPAGYPAPEPVRSHGRLWPLRRSTWREAAAHGERQACLPRQSDRAQARVRSLYAGANGELAALLRELGRTALPGWLTEG